MGKEPISKLEEEPEVGVFSKIDKEILIEAITDALENGNMNFNHIDRENSECWDTLERIKHKLTEELKNEKN